jgi:UDP-glucose 4-epimerase
MGVMPSRVVILGASGFVGQALLRLCAAQKIPTLAPSSRELDLTQPDAAALLAAQLRPDDCVVFAAAIDRGNRSTPEDTIRSITMASTMAAALTATPVAHLIYLSSDAVYPASIALVREATSAAAATLYGSMHRTRELILAAHAPVPQAVLRLSALYGVGDTHNAYGPNRFVREALADGRITLFGQGEECRDHLWMEDAVAMILHVAAMRATGLLNIASGRSLSFASVAQIVANHTGAAIVHTHRRQPITHRHTDPTARLVACADIIPARIEIKIPEICGFLAQKPSTKV